MHSLDPGRPSPPTAAGRIPGLDGIRGIAIAVVLLVHVGLLFGALPGASGWMRHTQAGSFGVDMFFVLSGALITTLLLEEGRRTGSIRLRSFYARRIRRLGPAIVVVVVATIALAVIEPWHSSFRDPRPLGPHPFTTTVAVLGFAANWLTVGAQGTLGWLGPTWSLGVEEQFYLTWPLALRAMLRARLSRRDLLLVLAVMLVTCQAGAVLLTRTTSVTVVGYYTPVRGIGILLGCLVAVLVRADGRSRRLFGSTTVAALAAIGAVLVAVSVSGHLSLLGQWGYLAIDTLFALVIGHCLVRAQRPSILVRLLEAPPLVGLGVISYGLYLVHVPVYLSLEYVPSRHLAPSTLAVLGPLLSIVIAAVLYVGVERPIRRRRRSGARVPAARVASHSAPAAPGSAPVPVPAQRPAPTDRDKPPARSS